MPLFAYLPECIIEITEINMHARTAAGIFWASNAAQAFFYRVDVRGARTELTNVTHRGSLIRTLPLMTSNHMLGLHRDGNLVLYDGTSGTVLSTLQLFSGPIPTTQTTPFLQHLGERTVFVAVPATGHVHEVLLNHGVRSMTAGAVIEVGGNPMHMVVATAGQAY